MAKIKKGYKQTDIGIIPEDWKVPNIIENSTLKARIGWQGLTTAEYLTSGDYFLVTGTDISKGRVNWDSCFYVDLFRYNQDRNIQLKNDDILITKDGTIGKVAFVDNMRLPGTLNSGVFVIRPKNNDYYPQFLFYIFNSRYFHLFLDKLVAGSTINHLYQKDFVTFKFPLPKPREQEAIASSLSDIDSLIDELTKLLDKKRAIKEGAMQQLLSPKEGWVEKTIANIADVKSGKRLPLGASLTDAETSHPYIRVSDMYNGGVYLGDIKYVPNDIFPFIKKYRIFENEIFISVAGTIGLVGTIPSILNGANLTENADKLTNIKCNVIFLKYLLQSKQYQLKLQSATTFGAQPKLALIRIRELRIYLPKSDSEQQKIASVLSDMDEEIEALEQNLSKYKAIKTGMMQQLLTGQIRLI